MSTGISALLWPPKQGAPSTWGTAAATSCMCHPLYKPLNA